MIRIGCSGWNYAHWRNDVFYPPRLASRDCLGFYAGRFDTVEVNTTFYRLPRPESVSRWVDATPDGFLFAVKASRYLTHVKRLTELPSISGKLLDRLAPLVRSPKLGPLLWQLPPNFRRDDERLAAALHLFPPRCGTLSSSDTNMLRRIRLRAARRHGVALVVADRSGAEALRREVLTASFTYVRFHAGPGNGNYPREQLDRWADRLSDWARSADVYAYFNNDWQGFAVEKRGALRAALGQPPVAA